MKSLTAALLLAFALVGCSGVDTTPSAPPAPATTGEDSDAALGAIDEPPTAQEVVDHFEAAGLPVPNPRDDTEQECESLGCTELITTDAVSVVAFEDEEAAGTYADELGDDAHRKGLLVLSYSAAQTPEEDRAEYETALAELTDV